MKVWSFQRVGTLLAVVVMASAANAHPPKPVKPDLVCDVSITLSSGRTVTNGETLELLRNASIDGTVHYAVRNRTGTPAAASTATRAWSYTTAGGSFPSAGGMWQESVPQLGPRAVKQLPDSQITIKSEGLYSGAGQVDASNSVNEEDENNNFCTVSFTVKHITPSMTPVEKK